ncbi:MAG: hypothetical protein N2D54_09690, partial [Chloroflexota bacterium]
RMIAYQLKLEKNDPAIIRIRDIYLSQWSEFGTTEELQAAYAIAYKLGMISRALLWAEVVDGLEGSEKAERASAVPGWLSELLDAQ